MDNAVIVKEDRKIGLKRRISFMSGRDQLERKNLIANGYKYISRDLKTSSYDTAAYKKIPILFKDIYIAQKHERTLTECFDFLHPGDILNLKTMDILRTGK